MNDRILMKNLNDEYFEWLCQFVEKDREPGGISFRYLLNHLYDTKFEVVIARDNNRKEDGENLRFRFGMDICKDDIQDASRIADELVGDCSLLEMMISLALRCEETIMDNAEIGDRTNFWFWQMIGNIGLSDMYNERYNPIFVSERLNILNKRMYKPNGEGGLFIVNNAPEDLRNVEIWIQMLWYLDNMS